MKSYYGTRIMATVLYGIVALLFAAFFIYMGFAENITVNSARHAHDYVQVQDYTKEIVADARMYQKKQEQKAKA